MKFNGYREAYVSDDDKKLWLMGSGASTLSSYNNYTTGDTNSSGSSGGSKVGTFFTGLFSCMVLIGAAFFAKIKMDRKPLYNGLEVDSPRLQSNDVELS